MASSDDRQGGRGPAGSDARRRYYPVRPAPPAAGGPPAQRPVPLAQPLPSTQPVPPAQPVPPVQPALPGPGPVVISSAATLPDLAPPGLAGADLAATVLGAWPELSPGGRGTEPAGRGAKGTARPVLLPVQRQVDVSQLSSWELRKEAAMCVDNNVGRARWVITDWLRS